MNVFNSPDFRLYLQNYNGCIGRLSLPPLSFLLQYDNTNCINKKQTGAIKKTRNKLRLSSAQAGMELLLVGTSGAFTFCPNGTGAIRRLIP